MSIDFEKEKFIYENKINQMKLGLDDHEVEIIKKNLPDKKYYEFVYHMLFQNKFSDLEKEWEKWQPWDIWHYPIVDLNRFNIIILQNANILRNKNVLDIGANLGYFSLFCLNLNSKSTIGIDVRENKLNLADFMCQKAGFKNYKFEKLDIGNTDNLLKVCEGIDTILFPGVIYHIANHYAVLSALSKSKATNMIIENLESLDFFNHHEPNIKWTQESVEGLMNGYLDSNEKVLVGAPNQSWINIVMRELGWKLKKINYFSMFKHNDHIRCCSVFER